ncbi:PaaI family thioesterase [Cochlodiniinecator piscidefendens]|uniref:PaaI family thioesterase n=1 Tax=Cochlodiniinecator piscidefendens TaxID=2715756 RepID=UPI00140E6D8E|nr:PaaI family thioesterase [Cochlodiniinecator piscidefendens]
MTLKMSREELAAYIRGIFPQVGDDFIIENLSDSETAIRLVVGEKHLRPGGTVSGPSMFALADVAMYFAILARIGREALAVTTNCSIDFMRKPEANTDLIARAVIHKLGRALVVGDVLIYSQGMEKPVARASLTYSIPPLQKGAGTSPAQEEVLVDGD